MGIQVTVRKPFSDHPRMKNSQTWQQFCFDNSAQNRMELYWIVPRCCGGEGNGSVANDFIILFEELIGSSIYIYKAPNDTGFLGRCSLLKSGQSGFRLWHVTYV